MKIFGEILVRVRLPRHSLHSFLATTYIFLLFLITSLLALISFVPRSFADSNFITSFDVTYTISEKGSTHAVFQGTLQNATDDFYASSYTLQSGFATMKNIQGYDNNGVINPVIKKTDKGNEINLPFNYKAIGQGQQTNFTLSFDTPDVASHVGNIWEINIPGIANSTDFKNFTVHLRVPRSFGQPTYIKPIQVGSGLDFTKDILGTGGISLAFGQQQNYAFTLNYHIKNDQLFPVTTEIALPPTTNYQDIAISNITPKPTNVVLDNDGNWLAKYNLYPSQKITVTVVGNSSVYLTPKKETLTDAQRKQYTQQDAYWDQNDKIKQLAKDLKTPKAIYDYVIGHLHYDFSRVAGKQERLGAATVLENPNSAVCLEFTDLFVAIARSAGIPAREIDGYAFTENMTERPLSLVKDILHAWPEYYDDAQGTWIMVDPTWGNTTKGTDYFNVLDFDHLAFVVKGAKSSYPIPAGGYKFEGQENIKDVFVSFASSGVGTDAQEKVDFTISPSIFSGAPMTGTVSIMNVGSILLPSQEIAISNPLVNPKKQTLNVSPVPPFGTLSVPVSFEKTSLLTNMSVPITIQVGENKVVKTVAIYPFFLQKQFIIGGTIVVIFCLIISFIATKAGSLSIFRRKR
jgi:transglutaminase-like putative cysteine protease